MAAKKTSDVFAGFTVVIEDASGQRRGSLTPDEFRVAMACPKTAFLADCVERWNARQAREGAEDRARIDMETRPSKREAAQFQRGRRIYEAGRRPRSHATKKDEGDVTDAQIRALRREAASAGDHAQALICDLALGDVVLDEDTTIDSLRIASFLSPRDKREISEMDPDDYRAACERAIEAGRG